ncbi:aminoglycoside adenylyltransferase domain-containing protein [Kineococcus rhizosphaerae]|uniref:Uncharacterized protein DUF4111 n=1 Tax=Kineococcus rhizosphaerae TaxID=559628 RepID=A0A2T0R805_9ACTN|nr:aminoglycoside adenylyltransferase domain-containing protein [Kineococcus rhizosphaerae]PRY17297.1 uncharacterized protein DUF4111 [Kineococcus rhizosphaerae]
MRLEEVLAELVRGARDVLGEDLVGAYQVGSFALGAADAASDVDVLVVTAGALDADAERGLRELHARLPDLDSGWARHLEGSYAPRAELRRPGTDPWLYVDNGHRRMQWSTHDNSLAVRWVLRHHGLVLTGPAGRDLVDPVSPDALRTDAVETLRRWDEDVRARPEQFGDLLAQQQHVLGLCRLLHRARHGRVVSKAAAAQWVQETAPEWGPLVREAVAGRGLGWDRGALPTPATVVAQTEGFHRHVLARSTA